MVIEGPPGGDSNRLVRSIQSRLLLRPTSVVEEFIPDNERGVLSGPELNQLRDLGMRLEEFFGSPQDVEWCIRGGKLLLLQSRAITTLGSHV